VAKEARWLLIALIASGAVPGARGAEYVGDGDPTAEEEEARWYANRMRFSPREENARLGTAYGVPDGPLQPVAPRLELIRAGRHHSEDLAVTRSFSHNSPAGSKYYPPGSDPVARVEAEGYNWGVVMENIAAGFETGAEVHQAWFDSSGHRANLLAPDLFEIGMGYYLDLSTSTMSRWYWTQDFGDEWQTEGCFFTDALFLDSDGNSAYTAGEGVGGVRVRLRTSQGDHKFHDLTGASGSFVVPIGTIPAGEVVEVVLKNTSTVDVVVSIPRSFSRLDPVELPPNRSQPYGTFVRAAGRRNVDFRSVVPYSVISIPIAVKDEWVTVQVWETASQTWIRDKTVFGSMDLRLRLVRNSWYWVGVWAPETSTWMFSGWFAELE
jgi:hypothetical protein